jgi:NitT/TauT family transport system substrate-binding protein
MGVRIMSEFRVRPRSHASLQDWIAADKGYFEDEGLTNPDFVTHAFDASTLNGPDLPEQKSGAYDAAAADPSKSDEATNLNTFCHWAVNKAIGGGHGRMWAHAYSWTISGIYVPWDSPIEQPEQLAGVPVAVGKRSGSHFSTVLSMEKYMAVDDINVQFVGLPNIRLALALDGKLAAVNGLGAPCYVLEQNGFRKIIDNCFMQGFLLSGDVETEHAQAYFRALMRAQQDVDLNPEDYKEMVLEHSVPAEFQGAVKNVAALGIPTRIVFQDYTEQMYEATRRWMDGHDFFDDVDTAEEVTAYKDAMLG